MKKSSTISADGQSNQTPWLYSETVKKHFLNPLNFITAEKPDFPFNGYGEVGNSACGDLMKVWLLIQGGRIKKMAWKTFGCASAIASTSILSEMVTANGGMEIETALKIKPQDIVSKLGGLPNIKVHCSVLGDQAIQAAIKDYRQKEQKLGKFDFEK